MRYFLSPQLDLYKNIARRFHDQISSDGSVLDYGCGTGFGTLQLLTTQHGVDMIVRGVDSDPEAVEMAKDVLGHLVLFEGGNWLDKNCRRAIGTDRDHYDVVTCIEVIEHTKDPRRLISLLAEAVKPGGVLILSTKNRFAGYRKNNAHEAEFDSESFVKVFAEAVPQGDFQLYDFTLENRLEKHVTPMVAVWRKPE
jgi:2-polyprenyl-3-methyl-5-hydroxy-6-metoxy-1,4-benzoquinol methylase